MTMEFNDRRVVKPKPEENPVFMRHPDEMGFLNLRDYAGTAKKLEFYPGGDSDKRVKKIMETASTEGIHEPISVNYRSGNPYIHDGHHRFVAAKRLGIQAPFREHI